LHSKEQFVETAALEVTGMTCDGCVRSVQRVLEQLPGVSRVEVSLAQGRAVVHFDPVQCSSDQLAAAVRNAGYEAR
jgi:copper chaperone CopZ